MAELHIHKNITVTGRVQGVFYRASTYEKAQQLGIKGFVRNQINGSVYIEAEGTMDQLEALIIWCKQGPDYAHVESLHAEEGQLEVFEKFEIKH